MTEQQSEFAILDDLRRRLSFYRGKHQKALDKFFRPEVSGFAHAIDDPAQDRPSLSSTATCYVSAINAGLEAPHSGFLSPPNAPASAIRALRERPWNSAKLKENNAFSVAFVLEVTAELGLLAISRQSQAESALAEIFETRGGVPEVRWQFRDGFMSLLNELLTGAPTGYEENELPAHEPGRIAMSGYPASAYLTQVALRGLLRFSELIVAAGASLLGLTADMLDRAEVLVSTFARSEMHRQISLRVANSKSADAYQLAYAILLDQMTKKPGDLSVDRRESIELAVSTFFSSQLPDGSWPRSQVLFHYPHVGNAYCFEFELMAQLLDRAPELEEHWLDHIRELDALVAFADRTRSQDDEAPVWSSGHHPQNPEAESWATASVYEALFRVARLASEKGRRLLFKEVGAGYPELKKPVETFASDLLDSEIHVTGMDPEVHSLREVMLKCVVGPIGEAKDVVERGYSFPEDLPTCMLLFGPPGTSKTRLAKLIAEYLGWPHLTIDTSYFLHEGTANIQAQADRIFKILGQADRVVVLLDEFDEMVRDRTSAPESFSRFLTTSMLPKLSLLNSDRRIVFIVATNYIENFDLAIRRGGRFDAIIQVMPPSLRAKKTKWKSEMAFAKDQLDVSGDDLDGLTFLETVQLVNDIRAGLDFEKVDVKERYVDQCTMRSIERPASGTLAERKWREACQEQRKFVRVPNIALLGRTPGGHTTAPETKSESKRSRRGTQNKAPHR